MPMHTASIVCVANALPYGVFYRKPKVCCLVSWSPSPLHVPIQGPGYLFTDTCTCFTLHANNIEILADDLFNLRLL